MDDLISRQETIDALDDGAEFLRRVLDDADIVGAERAKYEWGLGLIESYIYDMKELPSAQQWTPCSERLPVTKDDYIITVKDKYGTWTDYDEWSADERRLKNEVEKGTDYRQAKRLYSDDAGVFMLSVAEIHRYDKRRSKRLH